MHHAHEAVFPSTGGSQPVRHSPDDNSVQAKQDLNNKVSLLRVVLLGYLEGLAGEVGKDGAHSEFDLRRLERINSVEPSSRADHRAIST